jgi:hypothetical protein
MPTSDRAPPTAPRIVLAWRMLTEIIASPKPTASESRLVASARTSIEPADSKSLCRALSDAPVDRSMRQPTNNSEANRGHLSCPRNRKVTRDPASHPNNGIKNWQRPKVTESRSASFAMRAVCDIPRARDTAKLSAEALSAKSSNAPMLNPVLLCRPNLYLSYCATQP